MTGKNNEDRYSVSAYRSGQTNAVPSLFAIIADGIGGHRAGEVAAELAVETISKYMAESDASDPVGVLEHGIIHAGELIFRKADENPIYRGMGSTCACVWIIGNQLYAASVGDSRIYLIRQNAIHQLTIDHTWIQEAIDQGALRPEQARRHPNAHVIRRFLGSRLGVSPDFRLRLTGAEDDQQAVANQGAQLLPGDLILLCSDGLTDLVGADEILGVLQKERGEPALRELVELANKRGGHDNITIVTLAVPTQEPVTLPIPMRKLRKRVFSSCLAAVAGVALLTVIGLGLYIYLERSARDERLSETRPATQQVTLFPRTILTSTPVMQAAPAITAAQPDGVTPAVTIARATPQPPATLTPWPTNTSRP
jgi:protein phosphatase